MNLPVLDSRRRTISSPCAFNHLMASGPLSALLDVSGVLSRFKSIAVFIKRFWNGSSDVSIAELADSCLIVFMVVVSRMCQL